MAVGRQPFCGRWPSMQDNLCWKTTFGGRRPSVEDNIWWKTTFSGRRPSVEDDLRCKTTFDGRWPSVEDNLCWKMTFGGRQPSVKDDHLVEDDLQWKMTFSGRRPSVDPCMLPSLLCSICLFLSHQEPKMDFYPFFLLKTAINVQIFQYRWIFFCDPEGPKVANTGQLDINIFLLNLLKFPRSETLFWKRNQSEKPTYVILEHSIVIVGHNSLCRNYLPSSARSGCN